MYKVELSKKANKEFEKIPNIHFKKVISTFEELKINPYIGKQLVGELSGIYSIRVWPYRILYEIHKEVLLIQVIKIAHRKDVYK